MNLVEILIVGTNVPIMNTIQRLINQNETWRATIAETNEQAIDSCAENNFGLVLLCAGIENERELKIELERQHPHLPVIIHYGGGSGLLYTEIYQGLTSY
ncbi:MAG: hypothetical protein EOO90_03205 [Pedobacter sp.]|nr:MAG: hypothetical protein EOO90_03205 [Pedobacter sp.]